MEQKHWLKSYPEGVPPEVHPQQYGSLTQLLEESFRKNASRPFSVCMERWMTYGQLDSLSKALAAWLQGRGLEPGARVAIMLPNIPQFAVTMAAVLRAGYTCVNVNPLYTARELEHQLKDSGATAIVILENFGKTLEEVIDRTQIKHVVLAAMGDQLGFWYGQWITFAVRHLAKMVPAFKLPLDGGRTVTPFNREGVPGPAATAQAIMPNLNNLCSWTMWQMMRTVGLPPQEDQTVVGTDETRIYHQTFAPGSAHAPGTIAQVKSYKSP